MPRTREWKPHGTVSRYRQGGCNDVLNGGEPGTGDRCPECKAAQSEYNSQRGAGLAADERRPIGSVRSIASPIASPIASQRSSNTDGLQSNSRPSQSNSQSAMGPTERAVHEQLDQYRAEQPIRVELALNAARVLDDAGRVNIHHQARRDMSEIVKDLTAKRKTKSGGRLATVSAMAGRRSGRSSVP
jgi:hypothetical protein